MLKVVPTFVALLIYHHEHNFSAGPSVPLKP